MQMSLEKQRTYYSVQSSPLIYKYNNCTDFQLELETILLLTTTILVKHFV